MKNILLPLLLVMLAAVPFGRCLFSRHLEDLLHFSAFTLVFSITVNALVLRLLYKVRTAPVDENLTWRAAILAQQLQVQPIQVRIYHGTWLDPGQVFSTGARVAVPQATVAGLDDHEWRFLLGWSLIANREYGGFVLTSVIVAFAVAPAFVIALIAELILPLGWALLISVTSGILLMPLVLWATTAYQISLDRKTAFALRDVEGGLSYLRKVADIRPNWLPVSATVSWRIKRLESLKSNFVTPPPFSNQTSI